MSNLPFKAEYAKSGRSKCKLCKIPIEQASLRLAKMVQSPFHDGKDAHWFHSSCFFQKQRPATVGDIENFETLRYDDQESIKKSIANLGTAPATGGKGKGKGSKSGGGAAAASSDFSVGYAKSAASTCGGCEEKIPKKAVRISKKEYESQRAILYGNGNGMDKWHHVDCFVKLREDLQFFVAPSESSLPGFKDLDREDQDMLKKKLPAISQSKRKLDSGESNGSSAAKKIKTENGKEEKKKNNEEELIKKQNKTMYKNRDDVEAALKRPEREYLLSKNKQKIPHGGPSAVLDLVADIMTFGAMKPCPDCKQGQFVYKSGVGYQCTGYISEFTKCNYEASGDVERVPFKVPNDYKELPCFANKQFKVTKRIIPKHAAPVKGTIAPSASSSATGPKIVKNPLSGFKFCFFGVESGKKKKFEEKIKEFGGSVSSKCSGSIAAAITTPDAFNTSKKDVDRAKKYNVPVVSTEFVKNVKDVKYKLSDEISKCLLSDWIKDVKAHLQKLNQEYEKPREEGEESKVKKLILKDGAVVDPDSGLDNGPYHIYKEGKHFYSTVLNNMSIEEGLNSYYKIQIIESDNLPKEYYVFRAWGRIGTTIGGNQTDPMSDKQEAIDLFLEKYREKTGNEFGTKFEKKPGRYIRMDIDYGQNDQQRKNEKLMPGKDDSELALPVQNLIALIFDVEIFKRTMMEFEIDMKKMPLGKISRKQLLDAYSVLSESFNLREKEKDDRKLKRLIQDVTNRFFNLIPHDFGTSMPPLLDNEDLLRNKIEMLDNLMEIEIAYDLLGQGDNVEGSRIDSHYKTLKADIDVLETQSEEFNIIKKYLENTHAPTHSNYTLELVQVFKVVRKGESKRYRPFKELHNRRLLWHGSRVSNFAGILSQGLRIAPPEAPVTGYMFGKGIYFADMVSKSANYCNTSRNSPTGLLMLCEVALGDMHELKHAKDSLTKAPKQAHSVKGLGETEPDPTETYTFPDGVMVPYGKPTNSKHKNTSLLYNEYIVYDVAQVNVKYLLQVNFNYEQRKKR